MGTNAELQELMAQVQPIMDAFVHELTLLDRDYNIIGFNAVKKAHFPKCEVGAKCYEVFEERTDVCPDCPVKKSLETGQPYLQTNRLFLDRSMDPQGRRYALDITVAPLRGADGEIIGCLEVARDVTDSYHSGRRLKSLTEEYKNVVYVLSHDLLAPLISIQGFVAKLERLYGTQFDEKGWHCINRIKANIGFMDSLIKALLDTSRIINNNLNLQRADVFELVQNVIAQHAASVESLAVKVDVRPTLPPAYCDVVRTTQLFSNLVGNAIKFGAKTPNLKITIGFENGAYYVADNGPGIPPEFRQSMFRAFTRFADKDVPGLGMGLNIVHEIVDKHGGEIWLDTSHAPGTRLCFTLPTSSDA